MVEGVGGFPVLAPIKLGADAPPVLNRPPPLPVVELPPAVGVVDEAPPNIGVVEVLGGPNRPAPGVALGVPGAPAAAPNRVLDAPALLLPNKPPPVLA